MFLYPKIKSSHKWFNIFLNSIPSALSAWQIQKKNKIILIGYNKKATNYFTKKKRPFLGETAENLYYPYDQFINSLKTCGSRKESFHHNISLEKDEHSCMKTIKLQFIEPHFIIKHLIENKERTALHKKNLSPRKQTGPDTT